jgi:hypothetical protein
MKIYNENQIIENLKKCPHFDFCSRNFCSLDLELHFRSGREQDKCRYMRSPRLTKVKDKEFITGGATMSDAVLNFVPSENLERLNKASQERWRELNEN